MSRDIVPVCLATLFRQAGAVEYELLQNRAIVLAIIQGGMTTSQAANRSHVSTRWVRKFLTEEAVGATGPARLLSSPA